MRRLSKRLAVGLVGQFAVIYLVWFAIRSAAAAPDASAAIATIASTAVCSLIAAVWQYTRSETERPSQ